MENIRLDWPLDVVHCDKNSLVFLQNGETYHIHKRVFNLLKEDPSLPTFSCVRYYHGVPYTWINVPMSR